MPRPPIPKVIALTTLLAVAGIAHAQSDRDLREENQRLRTQVRDLQQELDAARQRIARLESELERLRQGAAPAATGPAEPEPVSIDESVPHASPRALLKTLQESYAETLRDLEIGDPGSRDRATYMRALEGWTKRVTRELKSHVEWRVRVMPITRQTPELGGLKVQAVDPQTGTKLGDPFLVTMPGNVVRRLRGMEQRGELDVLELAGVLVPMIRINPQRLERGTFDSPKFIGPFAEFGFVVQASNLMPVEEE